MQWTRVLFAAATAVAMAGASAAPSLLKAQPEVIDLGAAQYVAGQERVSVTIALKLRNTEQIEPLLKSTYTVGEPNYRKFLTPQEFNARFGPTAETVARVTEHFQKAGFKVTQLTGAHLSVSGSAAAMQAEFGVQLHAFSVAPTATTLGYNFRSPMAVPQVAAEIADAVQSVAGLDSRPHFRPHLLRPTAAQNGVKFNRAPAAAGPHDANASGALTVIDFARLYNVNPLYHSGV